MSRSVKHSPCTSCVTYRSNKDCKVRANRLMRRKSRQALKEGKEPIYRTREISDVWDFDSDGLPFWRFAEDFNINWYIRSRNCDYNEALRIAKDDLRRLLRK